ncbi:MAG: alpha/beta hydrolase [Defluviitaleaceae bacterium]|nr:alpha/beta hydrolase [Defluviitaleaceae bacterium]MCL2239599.1 alpha/beta hydrolase [Defluviitaleaceae bacterium]
MANFEYKGKKIYYETHGEGAPLILLNGIMMSTLSWQAFIAPLSAGNRLILLDFLDQGQSDKHSEDAYGVALQVEVLKALYDHLGLERAAIAGISYGGNVALKFASEYPALVHRLIVCNALAKTGAWLTELGKGWVMSAQDPAQFYYTTIPIIYSQEFYNARPDWVKARREFLTGQVFTNREWMDAIERLTASMDSYDAQGQLDKITAKTLLVASECDSITPAYEMCKLRDYIKGADLVLLPGTGHATMYERPALFASLIIGFANAELEGLVI